jgi:hypothetical protein
MKHQAFWPIVIFLAALLLMAGLAYLGYDRWEAPPP